MPDFIGPLAAFGIVGSTFAYYMFQYQYILSDKEPKYKVAREMSNGIFWTSVLTYIFLGGCEKPNLIKRD